MFLKSKVQGIWPSKRCVTQYQRRDKVIFGVINAPKG